MRLRTRRPDLVPIPAWPRMAAGLISIALVAGSCSSTSTSPAPPSPAATVASPIAVLPRSPSASPNATPRLPAPSADPATPPTPTPSPSPSPTTTPAPSLAPITPQASEELVVDAYAWVFDKHPMTLAGEAGTTRFTRVLFGAKTVDLRWKAAGDGTACTFAATVESRLMAKPVRVSAKVRAGRPAAGTRGITANYGDATITVTTDCARWSIKAVSTGHPGLVIKQQTRTVAIQGDTAAKVQAGDAVIAIQAAGRFQAAATKRTKYRSPTAMQDAIEQRCSTFIESAQDRTNEYDVFTRRGFTQGVDIG